ncbi:restriction endonuclease subunit S [Pseudomonas sp. FJ2-5-13]|uniref:restriction endonuclease subunit S n=1 Tax=Pseudomonas sp. FJ2-5-13 TaxID=2976884 RepID=UPI0023D7FE04|nr:restriction endonuclease subunit S [Pseudomonas sp. FJ2-5-13]WEJ04913.1 restriction endonuclease subunit S [Pseudomonas sp. FJ2-5-13]
MSSKLKTMSLQEDDLPTLVPKLRFPQFQDAESWGPKELGECLDYLQPTKFLVNSTAYDDKYETPVVTAGKTFILGYTNETEGVFDHPLPVIIFDDFTTASQYVDFQFKAKSSAMKILLAKKGANIKFIYESMQRVNYEVGAHGRHWISAYSKIRVAVPKPDEQKKIADCLSSVDDLIAVQARKVHALKTHKKGLMQLLFPREGENQPRLRFPEFQNDGEWEVCPFDKFVTKSFYGTSSSTSPKGQYPVLRMGNMVDGGLDFTNLVYIDLDPDSFESFRLEDGDILLNRTNSPALVGKISLFRLKSECITASYIVTYRLNKQRINPSFCNFMLNTPLHQAQIKTLAKPSISQANINPTTFRKELIVAVPTIPEQLRIADCLTSLDDLITAQIQKLAVLKMQKKGLTQQLFPAAETAA